MISGWQVNISLSTTEWPRNYESWPKFQIILCTFRLLLCITQQTQSTLWHHKTAFDCQTSPATPSTSMPSPWKGLRARLDNIIHNRLWHLSISIKIHPTNPKYTLATWNPLQLLKPLLSLCHVYGKVSSFTWTHCMWQYAEFCYASFDLYSTSLSKLKVH